MLRLTFSNGNIEIENPELEARLLIAERELQIKYEKEAQAEQLALSTVYRVGGKPDPSRPWDGLLTKRLDISESTAGDLIREGRIGYVCCGKKAYRVSEHHVREYLGLIKKTA